MTTTTTTSHPSPATRPVENRRAIQVTRDDAKAVASALRSEWIKVSTLRANQAVLALTIIGGLLVSWAVAKLVTGKVLYVSEVGFYWTTITSALAAISGALLFTSEAQHGTLATAVTARPARWVIALAKTLTAAAIGLVLGVAGLVTGFGGSALGGLGMGDTSALPATLGWALVFTTLSAVLGLGLGMILRHSAAAVGGFLVWGFVVENLLHVFLPAQVARFLPFVAGNHLLGYNPDFETAKAIAIALTQPQNALVFAGYTALALVTGTVLLHRRDPN
jgi:ABC-2 type transport system permease protein